MAAALFSACARCRHNTGSPGWRRTLSSINGTRWKPEERYDLVLELFRRGSHHIPNRSMSVQSLHLGKRFLCSSCGRYPMAPYASIRFDCISQGRINPTPIPAPLPSCLNLQRRGCYIGAYAPALRALIRSNGIWPMEFTGEGLPVVAFLPRGDNALPRSHEQQRPVGAVGNCELSGIFHCPRFPHQTPRLALDHRSHLPLA